MAERHDSTVPLLDHLRYHVHGADPNDGNESGQGRIGAAYSRYRRRGQQYLDSKEKHYIILALVALDVMCILADIFLALIACDTGQQDEDWVGSVRDGLSIPGLVFSCLFLVELLLCVWAFGIPYFYNWFHCFDALVIIVSFVADTITHGLVEEIASLVVILRLWRFVKIVEELSVGASERMDEMQAQLDTLEKENENLRDELRHFNPREGGGDEEQGSAS